MESLTLQQINELIVNAGGENFVATSATFSQITASNEAMYKITYNVNDEVYKNNIFVIQKEDGSFQASINTLLYSV